MKEISFVCFIFPSCPTKNEKDLVEESSVGKQFNIPPMKTNGLTLGLDVLLKNSPAGVQVNTAVKK